MSNQRQKKKKTMLFTSSQTEVKGLKRILLLWPPTPFFVILLASGLATAFLSQDEAIKEKSIKEDFIHTQGSLDLLSEN